VAAALIALGVGTLCLIASLLRLGKLASLLSRPILAGFFVGIAVSIIIGQIGRVTGLAIDAEGVVLPLMELTNRIGAIHMPSLLLAAGMFAILQLSHQWPILIPGPVIVVLLSVALSALLGFEDMGIGIVGDLPAGLPALALPWLPGLNWGQLILGSAAVFVVSFGAGIITARSFGARTGEVVNANAELTGFGAANIASGLVGGFPVTSSDSRTAVNLSVGGRSQVAGLTAAAVLGLAMLFFSDLLQILPIPALGGHPDFRRMGRDRSERVAADMEDQPHRVRLCHDRPGRRDQLWRSVGGCGRDRGHVPLRHPELPAAACGADGPDCAARRFLQASPNPRSETG
jgi:MFS superfamily sulfate permease-like transporter